MIMSTEYNLFFDPSYPTVTDTAPVMDDRKQGESMEGKWELPWVRLVVHF